jgi:ABC-type dipeptide/oligopeptide/nickel transport system permease subunit
MKKFSLVKGLKFSLIVTLIIEVIFFIKGSIIGLFSTYCKTRLNCSNQFEAFLPFFVYTAIPIFILTLILYWVYNSYIYQK